MIFFTSGFYSKPHLVKDGPQRNLSMQFLGSIVVSIPACHAGDRNSIPRRGDEYTFFWLRILFENTFGNQPKKGVGKRSRNVVPQQYNGEYHRMSRGRPKLNSLAQEKNDLFYFRILFKTAFGERRSTKNSEHVIPRQYSDEHPRLQRQRPGSIPRRGEEYSFFGSGFHLEIPL